MDQDRIDRLQLKTLLKVSLKADLWMPRNRLGVQRQSSIGFPPLIGVVLMYLLVSVFLGAISWKADQLFLGTFVVAGMVMVFIAISILLEFSNLILNPDDYAILAPHPVNSRTFFAAKVLHLLIYVTILTASMSLVPCVVTAFRQQNLLLFPATFISIWSGAAATSMFFVIFYTLMLRFASRETMSRYLSYLQLVFLFFIYGGYIWFPKIAQGFVEWSRQSIDLTYLYFTPPGWYAAWVQLAAGHFAIPALWAAVAGIVVLIALYTAGASRLSMQYALTLADTVQEQESESATRRGTGFFTRLMNALSSPEDKVVWKLMRAQFKYDNRYKMAVLTMVPLTLFYLFLGLRNGETLIDPFAIVPGVKHQINFMFYFGVAMVPYMVIISTTYSSAYSAAWVYFASPANRQALVLSSSRFTVIFFCVPYLVFAGIVFSYFFGSVLHAVLHCITLFLLLQALVNFMALVLPRFPFSVPAKSGQRVGTMMLSFLVPLPIMLVPTMIISYVGYGGSIGYSSIVLGLILVNMLLTWLQRKFIPRQLDKLEFVES